MIAWCAMVRAVVLIAVFGGLLWLAALSEAVQVALMFAGVFAVCWTVDRLGRSERRM